MSSAPQVHIGKLTDEHLHARHILPLPSDTPFGNLALKFLKLIERLDHSNRTIKRVYASFEGISRVAITPNLTEHLLLQEEVVYWLRKSCDELISLNTVIARCRVSGAYPTAVNPDSIGALLAIEPLPPYAAEHATFLSTINDIANAYKHSFINSEINRIGAEEPVVFALGLKRNSLANVPTFYTVSLRDVIEQFNMFYLSSVEELRASKLPHLTSPSKGQTPASC